MLKEEWAFSLAACTPHQPACVWYLALLLAPSKRVLTTRPGDLDCIPIPAPGSGPSTAPATAGIWRVNQCTGTHSLSAVLWVSLFTSLSLSNKDSYFLNLMLNGWRYNVNRIWWQWSSAKPIRQVRQSPSYCQPQEEQQSRCESQKTPVNSYLQTRIRYLFSAPLQRCDFSMTWQMTGPGNALTMRSQTWSS